MRITLTVTAGPHKGRAFTFAGHDTFLVGRSKRAHFRLPVKDKYFSRIHFLVEVNPPHCRLLDMDSRNGTRVNGAKVSTASLRHGDRIRAGHTRFRVTLEGDPEAAAAASPGSVLHEARLQADSDRAALRAITIGTATAAWLDQAGAAAVACRACGAAVRKAPPSPPGAPLCPLCLEQTRKQPQPIPGYQIIRELGRGGMGVVYLALHRADGMRVALKTIIPTVPGTPAEVTRFLREADILRQLRHPRIVAFHDMGVAGGTLYFAMEHVPGRDARAVLKESGPLPVRRAAGLVCQLLEALEYAHARGFVHRDVKPANLLVIEQDGCDAVKLADFGLARAYLESRLSGLTLAGDVGGTLPFMAPEQISNFRDAKPAADQYAAAATLYNLLTKHYLYDFPAKFEQRLLMILHQDPVPVQSRRPDLPGGLATLVHRGLSRKLRDRFADVRAMRLALLPYCR